MSEHSGGPRSFVLDSSVTVKWYLPEKEHEEAAELLRRAESEDLTLLAPSTIYPEFFNALRGRVTVAVSS